METPGALVVARIPSANIPVCVFTSVAKCVLKRAESVGEMACVRACGKLKRRQYQMEDGNGEPNRLLLAILRTAPGSRDVANEACAAFSERPSRAHHRGGIPVRERPAYRKRPSRGRLRWRVLGRFGTRGSPRGCVFGAFHATHRVFCSRNTQSGFLGRYARVGLHGKPRRFGVRVTSSAGISRHECRGNSARCLPWGFS